MPDPFDESLHAQIFHLAEAGRKATASDLCMVVIDFADEARGTRNCLSAYSVTEEFNAIDALVAIVRAANNYTSQSSGRRLCLKVFDSETGQHHPVEDFDEENFSFDTPEI